MKGKAGDQIVIEAMHVGGESRKGTILEVIETATGVTEYRVRWSDGHESRFIPTVGSARFVPAQEIRA
jgi:hypothetical protein